MSIHKGVDEIDALGRALADDSRRGFFGRRRAARRLARLAMGVDGSGHLFSPAEARAVIEGLIAGMEGFSSRAHRTCLEALERLKDQSLKEAVCDRLIEGDLPRLRAIAVQARYEPQDPARRAIYLFVLGSSQLYEAHDPNGELLEQFYVETPSPIRDRLLGLARSWGEKPLWTRLITGLLRDRGWTEMSQAEAKVVLEVLSDGAQSSEREPLEQLYGKAPRWVRIIMESLGQGWEKINEAEVKAALEVLEVLSDEAHGAAGGLVKLLKQSYMGTSTSLRDRLLGLARSWGDQRWYRLITVVLQSRKWAEMSEAELAAAVEMLADEAYSPQRELLPLRDQIVKMTHRWKDRRWERLITINLRSRGARPKWLIENQQDGTLLVLIPEGEFLAGDKKLPVRLPAYYLAAHPVTNAQYKKFVKATGHRPPNQFEFPETPVWKGRDFPPEVSDHPVVGVSWGDAQAYCRWAGLRLPTELEWEKGARGIDGREYPWGNDWERDHRCRWSGSWWTNTTCDIWSYPDGCSPWGLYHMAGNVWEWCEDWFWRRGYGYPNREHNLMPAASGEYRVLTYKRVWQVYSFIVRLCRPLLVRLPQSRPGEWRYHFAVGFRCAKSFA